MIDELQKKFGSRDDVQFALGQGNLPVCNIVTPVARAQVYLHGAHVSSYEPTGEKPVIYMSPRSKFDPASPIRGGVPICFPWFGPHEADTKLPAHGFARIQPWQLTGIYREGDAVTLSLQLDSGDTSKKFWPFEFRAIYRVTVAAQMKLELEVVNWSDRSFDFTEALHTYFCVSDVRNVSVSGLENVRYNDKVAGGLKDPAGVPIRFDGETDRVYMDTSDTCVIHDPGMNRRIEVSKSGSRSTVVWNPYVKKAALLGDLGEDTWPNFCCVETANALSNRVMLNAGEKHIVSQSIRVLRD